MLKSHAQGGFAAMLNVNTKKMASRHCKKVVTVAVTATAGEHGDGALATVSE